ncbi:unnamed protein product [Cylicocyclus nassatus]|uniref:G-protein coupled receptors family 1 profile domain-containing protein n=1 Tax=Cylicocyclus nassatus TaxID=53992 RepID=A0AA36MFH0_CYLNA|nr:unnamed protein product [Cylicocyclus nassatus]
MLCTNNKFSVENISAYVMEELNFRCNSETAAVITSIAYSIIIFVGLVGNVCTCIVIWNNQCMHTQTNIYLASLAVTDLLLLFIGLPLEVVKAYQPFTFGELVCTWRMYLVRSNSVASIFLISALTVERWLAVKFPFRYRPNAEVKQTIRIVVALWSASLILPVPVLCAYQVERVPLPIWGINQTWTRRVSDDGVTIKKTEFCDWDDDGKYFEYHCVLISKMYCDIAKEVGSSDLPVCYYKSDVRAKTSKNVFKMLVLVAVCFFVTWLPFHVQRLLLLIIKYHEGKSIPSIRLLHSIFYKLSECFYVNCATNPFLYNMFSRRFRKNFLSTIIGSRLAKRIRPEYYK